MAPRTAARPFAARNAIPPGAPRTSSSPSSTKSSPGGRVATASKPRSPTPTIFTVGPDAGSAAGASPARGEPRSRVNDRPPSAQLSPDWRGIRAFGSIASEAALPSRDTEPTAYAGAWRSTLQACPSRVQPVAAPLGASRIAVIWSVPAPLPSASSGPVPLSRSGANAASAPIASDSSAALSGRPARCLTVARSTARGASSRSR